MALMAIGIGSSSRTSTRLAFNTVENTKARLLADAGVQQAIFNLLTDEGGRLWLKGGDSSHAFALGGDRVQIEIRDEDGKIDINVAPSVVLEGLFTAIGAEEDQAAMLASRVVDFRDDDSDPEQNGAEDPAYEAAGRAKGAADRPFRRIEELADVLGLSDILYQRMRPHVTIYSDAEGIDPLSASPAVLRAIPGITPEIEAAISASATADDVDLILSSIDVEEAADYLLPSRELLFSIRALGISEGGGRFVRDATIALDGGVDELPFTIYTWQRGTLRPDE
ncbi:MAG: general secretion pathway protein GspK [Geminicoccales bacterium]